MLAAADALVLALLGGRQAVEEEAALDHAQLDARVSRVGNGVRVSWIGRRTAAAQDASTDALLNVGGALGREKLKF